jgi:hypothetical protein
LRRNSKYFKPLTKKRRLKWGQSMHSRNHSHRRFPFVGAHGVKIGCCAVVAALALLGAQGAQAQARKEIECGNRVLQLVEKPEEAPDVKVTGKCEVSIGSTGYYGNVNILKGGSLRFHEGYARWRTDTHFWANSIIIENGGALIADGGVGMDTEPRRPYGEITHGTLTIHLYGENEARWNQNTKKFDVQNAGTPCKTTEAATVGPCGIPLKTPDGKDDVWTSNGAKELDLPGQDKNGKPVHDWFYQYGALYGDARCAVPNEPTNTKVVYVHGKCMDNNGDGPEKVGAKLSGFFGNKVLAVSYGATLQLVGNKGAVYDARDSNPLSSGLSWMRLEDGRSVKPSDDRLYLEKARDTWETGDEIVVTTTDYLPGHSEKLTIAPGWAGDNYVHFEGKAQWHHNGVRYGGPHDKASGPPWSDWQDRNKWVNRLEPRLQKELDPELWQNGAETRAAVALLTRSIRIVSAGNKVGQNFPEPETDTRKDSYHYGAHMVIRQGFEKVQIQGVEFKQMGQGGRLAHYPVHFHMARRTPDKTYIKDSSINESMTRWIVIHSTQGVTVARNVGYKSIGHGFYLEDGTETDNKFHSNLGIFARAAVANVDPTDSTKIVANPQNPRRIPGILADNTETSKYKDVPGKPFIYRSDVENPTVFWITNGWNDFIGNMAAGAGTCGAAYWFVPVANSDHVEVSATHKQMNWKGYAGLQKAGTDPDGLTISGLAGTTPLKSFYKNYATSTMHSFQTTGDAPECLGVIAADVLPGNAPVLRAVPSDAPKMARRMYPKNPPNHEEPDTFDDPYYPHIGSLRYPVRCDATADGSDCSKITRRCDHVPDDTCALTVLDHYTSSFHWAHGNVSAIWLRPQWYLLTNSVLSDIQNGGVTFITGGDYTHSSVIDGYWGLAKSSVFIGNTQDPATNPYASNLGPFNALSKLRCDTGKAPDQYCVNANETISMPTSGFFTNQRLANIYDGPSYQDSNAYLDIKTAECPQGDANSGCMYATNFSYLRLKTKPGDPNSTCYLPNAAIGWKQPNGFFYPPAFHTRNLQFENVDLRHYVINPLFQEGTYLTDPEAVKAQYCVEEAKYKDLFIDFTSIDRQTVLNDTDGTLTGLSNSLPDSKDPLQQRLKQTLSINEDSFFSAPRETAECGSAAHGIDDGKGGNADAKNACDAPVKDKPPVTARTSPYDYVATVLFHRKSGDTDVWNTECTNQGCYGVPLYRQYLTKDELKRWADDKCKDQAIPPRKQKPECRWPFIRMSGEALSQRGTLTINNGTYYLDTTVRQATQETENYTTKATGTGRWRNVFKSGETYYMFFTYAKTNTVQTYQIYVGTDFNEKTMFKPGRMDVDGFIWLDKSPSEAWVKPEKGADGILTVTVDFSTTMVEPTPDRGLCQPRTFCKPGTDPETNKPACVSNLKADDPLVLANKNFAAQNATVCQTWAAKDLDCPPVVRKDGRWIEGGCYAFAFTLPTTSFEADDQYRRPEPGAFPAALDPRKKQGLPDWTTKFTQGVKDQKDSCFYPKVPGTDCKLP